MTEPAIDAATGTLALDSVPVGPGFSRSDLLSSPIGPKLEELASSDLHHSWKASVEMGGRPFVACFFFTGEQLTDVTLSIDDGRLDLDWRDWSEDRELARRTAHERWLRDETGMTPPMQFEWGSIVSVYDDRAGDSYLGITYNPIVGRT